MKGSGGSSVPLPEKSAARAVFRRHGVLRLSFVGIPDRDPEIALMEVEGCEIATGFGMAIGREYPRNPRAEHLE
jgi:hypothetical protein